jgi:branched-chain amino acid transport system ATP-binding protein
MTSMLNVKDLRAYYGQVQALHGLSFSLNEGSLTTLLGANGAGKTTTLRAIMGILRRRTGSIRLRGKDIMSRPLHAVARAGLGYVPEERGIFASLDVMENLTLPPVTADGGMSLDEIFTLFPNLAERRRSQGTKLSGGEQQMLAIARILRTGARILLFDEPTEGLAPVIVRRIGEVIAALKARGFTILLVEQNFGFARTVADRFYVMEDGRIVDHSAVAALDSREASLHEILGV